MTAQPFVPTAGLRADGRYQNQIGTTGAPLFLVAISHSPQWRANCRHALCLPRAHSTSEQSAHDKLRPSLVPLAFSWA